MRGRGYARLLAFLGILCILALTASPGAVADPTEVVIGVVLPLSGPFAQNGQQGLWGGSSRWIRSTRTAASRR